MKTILAICRNDQIYPTIETELKIFQTAALLEVRFDKLQSICEYFLVTDNVFRLRTVYLD